MSRFRVPRRDQSELDKAINRLYYYVLSLQELQGNLDGNTIVTQELSPEIIARYVKVHPKTFHTAIALRVEFHGWYGGE